MTRALLLVVGQPAAGKTTWLTTQSAVVSYDRMPGRLARTRREILLAWQGGATEVCTDVRCRTRRHRARWIAWATQHGATTSALYVTCDERERRQRLRRRGIASGSLHGWTLALEPPTREEGLVAVRHLDTTTREASDAPQ